MVSMNVVMQMVNLLKYMEEGKEYTTKELQVLSKMCYPSVFNYMTIISMKGWAVESRSRHYMLTEKGKNVVIEYFKLLEVMEIDEVIPEKKAPKEKPITEYKTQEELNKSIVEDDI